MTPTSFTVSWTAPTTGTPPLVYIVQYRVPLVTSVWTDFGSTVELTQLVVGLTASTTYDVRIKVSNRAGTNFSAVASATTPLSGVSPSAEGTLVPPATSIINAQGITFTILSNGQVGVTGVGDSTTSNVTLLYYHLGRVYRKQTTINELQVLPGWWYKVNAADAWTPSTDPTGADSAEGTQIAAPATGPAIIDFTSEIVTRVTTSGGQVAFNGVTDLTSTGVTLIYYHNDAVYYQQGATGPWFFKTSAAGTWASTTDPRGTVDPAITVPGQVQPLTIGAITQTSIVVSWPLLTTGSPPTSYQLQYKTAASSTYLNAPINVGESPDGTLISASAVTPTPGPGVTESAQGTTLSTTTGSITDASLASWTLATSTISGLGVRRNGAEPDPANVTANVTLLLYYNHTVFKQATTSGSWTSWNGSAWIATTDPRSGTGTPSGSESPQGTQLTTTTGAIIDSLLARWTLATSTVSGLGVRRDGAEPNPADVTAEVILLLYYNHQVYHETAGFGWFVWNGSSSTWASTTDPRVGGVPGVPAPASAVGYNTRTLGPTLTLGTNWYRANHSGIDQNALSVTQNATGSITCAGPGRVQITATQLSGGGFLGTAFGGGAYIEATISWANAFAGTGSGWPAWWARDIEGLLGESHWSGQAASYVNEVELDISEYLVNGTSWASTIHNFYGVGGSTQVAPATRSTSGDSNSHQYGCLWVPATSTTRGYCKFYFDRTYLPTFDVSWDIYNSATSPPPVAGTTAWSRMDATHLMLALGSSAGNPMTITSAEVWQASAALNRPAGGVAPVGGPGTGPPLAQPVTGALSLNGGWKASRDTNPLVFGGGTGRYSVFTKTYFFSFFSRPGEDGYFFNGVTAAFLNSAVFLYTPDVTPVFSVPGLPASPVDPVSWVTAGAVGGPVEWIYYAEPVALTSVASVFVDFSSARGDTFSITPNLRDSGGNLLGVCRSTAWGSWVDFTAIGAGWIAFLNYNMTPGQIGVHPFD